MHSDSTVLNDYTDILMDIFNKAGQVLREIQGRDARFSTRRVRRVCDRRGALLSFRTIDNP